MLYYSIYHITIYWLKILKSYLAMSFCLLSSSPLSLFRWGSVNGLKKWYMKIHLFLTGRISGHFGHFPDSRNFGHFPIRTRAHNSRVRGLYVCPNQSLSPGLLVSKSDKTDFDKKNTSIQGGKKHTKHFGGAPIDGLEGMQEPHGHAGSQRQCFGSSKKNQKKFWDTLQ